MTTLLRETVLESNSRGVALIYLSIAAVLALVALMLLTIISAANNGLGPRAAGLPFLPSLPSFLELLGSMLGLAALAGALASVQATMAGSGNIKAATAWCFGGCALGWGFVGAWLLHETSAPGSPVWSIPVLALGSLLMLTLASSAMLFLVGLGRRVARFGRVWALSTYLFALAGFPLIVWSIWQLWCGGLSEVDWLVAQGGLARLGSKSVTSSPGTILWLYPHPILIALGSMGLIFASQRRSSDSRALVRLISALCFVVGLGLVVPALIRRTGFFPAGGLDGRFFLGFVLTSVALVGAGFQPGGNDPTSLRQAKILELGGVALVLIAGWHMWYTQLALPQSTAVEATGWSYPVTAALGALAAALGHASREAVYCRKARTASAVAFVVGAALLGFGLYHGFGVRTFWRLDVSTITGVLLLFASLVADLFAFLKTMSSAQPLQPS